MGSIWEILDWLLYGLVRYVLYLIPVIKAPRVYRGIPGAWWVYNSYDDWLHKDDDDGHPDEVWGRSCLEMAFGELQALATAKAKPYVDAVRSTILTMIGYIRPGFPSMGGWVNWLQVAVGYFVPSWAGNVASGLDWLRDRFPAVVRFGIQSWAELWESIKSSVRSWAMARYDQAKAWAQQNLGWIVDVGESLRSWRDRVAGWVDWVRYDPRGFIVTVLGSGIEWLLSFAIDARARVLGWLGPEWPRIVTFARDCLTFYYNLWASGWATLGHIVEDPKGWLMDRLEQAVMDRW